MEKNIKCSKCKANAFHIDRDENGIYVLKCMTSQACERKFKLEENVLSELGN